MCIDYTMYICLAEMQCHRYPDNVCIYVCRSHYVFTNYSHVYPGNVYMYICKLCCAFIDYTMYPHARVCLY